MPHPLPLLGEPTPERSDAARNREVLLAAGRALIAECGVGRVTTDAVAERAGVGKGTVFRRFGSREGLMRALLDDSERTWQAAVIGGPPPLGPGADAWDRLLAFGGSRLRTSLLHADLLRAAGGLGSRSHPAYVFSVLHLRHLFAELGTGGEPTVLATALLAPLEAPLLDPDLRVEDLDVDALLAAWADLAARVVRR